MVTAVYAALLYMPRAATGWRRRCARSTACSGLWPRGWSGARRRCIRPVRPTTIASRAVRVMMCWSVTDRTRRRRKSLSACTCWKRPIWTRRRGRLRSPGLRRDRHRLWSRRLQR